MRNRFDRSCLSSVLLWITCATIHRTPLLTNFLVGCSALSLTPSTKPEDIIRNQLSALQLDDMDAVYRYASPNNKKMTGGDVDRFGQMVRSGPYRYLIRHRRSEILLESKMAESRQYLVRVTPKEYPANGRVVEYWWSLSRCQGGDDVGSYMVDAVIPNI
jgi:hypothetical protein